MTNIDCILSVNELIENHYELMIIASGIKLPEHRLFYIKIGDLFLVLSGFENILTLWSRSVLFITVNKMFEISHNILKIYSNTYLG